MAASPVAGRYNEPMVALLVDRDPEARRLYADVLSRSAYLIEQAEDGREALAKVFSRHPVVVVTETRVPGINGFELCALLRQDAATRGLAIVLVTDDSLASDAERAQTAGADILLAKPCLPEQLLAEVERLVQVSEELRERSRVARDRMHEQVEKSGALLDRSRARRKMLSSAHTRHDTTTPEIAPPALTCPGCDHPLRYVRSHIGGVTAHNSEQWDYFECPAGCGPFQYRERTRKLRRV
jgi:CheY-like chemotaxis protein